MWSEFDPEELERALTDSPDREPRVIRLYHRTDAVDEILARGFSRTRGLGQPATGVWFSDQPSGAGAAGGQVVLTVEFPEAVVEQYEWIPDHAAGREFLIPPAWWTVPARR